MIKNMSAASRGIRKIDVAIAVLLSLLGLYLMYENTLDPTEDVPGNQTFLILPLFLTVTIPVAWRRAAPLGAMASSSVALLVNIALVNDVVRCGVAIPVLLLLAFSVAAHVERRGATAGLALALAGGIAVALSDPILGGATDVAFVAALIAGIWATGRLVRSRSKLGDALRERTSELQGARDSRARMEIAADRARISTELDELLQRRLGELAALADEGPRSGDAKGTNATLVTIENQSRQTLEEMRALVGALRTGSVAGMTSPQPTLTHLDALVLRAKGVAAGLSVEGSPRTLPAGVELSAYRIVEHLLAAVDDKEVGVVVRFADEALELTVTGSPKRRGSSALERARERALLHDGTLEASTRDGRAHLRALLPLLSPATT